MFQCRTCKKEFKLKHYLDDHIKQIHEYSKYYCDLCNTSFKYSRNLQRHKKLIHNGSNFKQGLKCPVCNVVVKLKGSLLRHIRKKHPEAYKRQCADHQAKMEETRTVKFKCVTCNKEVKSEVALLRHIKTKHPDEGKIAPNRGNVHSESVVEIKVIFQFNNSYFYKVYINYRKLEHWTMNSTIIWTYKKPLRIWISVLTLAMKTYLAVVRQLTDS